MLCDAPGSLEQANRGRHCAKISNCSALSRRGINTSWGGANAAEEGSHEHLQHGAGAGFYAVETLGQLGQHNVAIALDGGLRLLCQLREARQRGRNPGRIVQLRIERHSEVRMQLD